MNRRDFLRSTVVVAGGAVLAPTVRLGFAADPAAGATTTPTGIVRAGVITDLHHMMFGKNQIPRLKAFADAVAGWSPDFVLQCGDLCYPDGWPAIEAEWNRYPGDKHHVLGNHDMDKCDKQTAVQLWGMPGPYYSFDKGGFHFVVLDRNCFRTADKSIVGYAHGNWGKARSSDLNCVDEEQLAWLEQDLDKTEKPAIIWAHQPLIATDNPGDIGNGGEILRVFDEVNFRSREKTGRPRVIAAFFGHDHNDLYGERNGVHYVLLNSASYAYTAAGASFYLDPLFALITFDPAGTITVQGRATTYGPQPAPDKVRMRIPPKISGRNLSLPAADVRKSNP
jgi:hypothetical protein